MGYVSYNKGDGILEIVVKDETGAKIDRFATNLKDKKRFKAIMNILSEKYNLGFNTDELFDF